MRTVQHSVFQPGTKVLFFSSGMPHTGTVEKAFDNVCEIHDITFLNEALDNPVWQIETKDLIKTDQFYLPKYPTISEITYVQAIVNQCYTNKDCNDVYYEGFEKLFPKKTLLSDKVSPFLVGCQNAFITLFEPNLLIRRKNDPCRIYTPLELLLPNNEFYIVLEGFETLEEWAKDSPSILSVPCWKDKKHGDRKYAKSLVPDAFDKHASSCAICPEFYIEPEMDENSIENIWVPNEVLMEQSIYNDNYHSITTPFLTLSDDGILTTVISNLDRIY